MDFIQVIANRRSVRKFKDEPVPEEALNKVLEAGRWAPSAGNSQPWRFIVVTDADVKRKIADVSTEFSKRAWAEFSPTNSLEQVCKFVNW